MGSGPHHGCNSGQAACYTVKRRVVRTCCSAAARPSSPRACRRPAASGCPSTSCSHPAGTLSAQFMLQRATKLAMRWLCCACCYHDTRRRCAMPFLTSGVVADTMTSRRLDRRIHCVEVHRQPSHCAAMLWCTLQLLPTGCVFPSHRALPRRWRDLPCAGVWHLAGWHR